MIESLYQGDFLNVFLLQHQNYPILKNIWQENSQEMEDDDFKAEIEQWCQLVEKHKPKGCMVNSLQFRFTISPDLQDWYNENITPHKFKAGLQKMAFIVPEELLSELSIEQIFDEQEAITFKYVASEEEALNWL